MNDRSAGLPNGSTWRRGAARSAMLCAVAFVLLVGAGCSAKGRPAVRPGHGSWIVVASWYGPKYHGRQTASGEVYDMHGRTAAHKTLPFGTRLRVTHVKNKRSIVVRVNDRGPFIKGRGLDLSYGAAAALNMVNEGIAEVKIERLK